MRDRDPLGYYAILNLDPSASDGDVRRAYGVLRLSRLADNRALDIRAAQVAYEILADPVRRAEYDQATRFGTGRLGIQPWMRQLALGGILLLAVLSVQMSVCHGPSLRATFNHFDRGETIYKIESRSPFATIVNYERRHRFPRGIVKAGYLIQPVAGGEPRWYPASDLERYYESR